jgi:hypothetical protein
MSEVIWHSGAKTSSPSSSPPPRISPAGNFCRRPRRQPTAGPILSKTGSARFEWDGRIAAAAKPAQRRAGPFRGEWRLDSALPPQARRAGARLCSAAKNPECGRPPRDAGPRLPSSRGPRWVPFVAGKRLAHDGTGRESFAGGSARVKCRALRLRQLMSNDFHPPLDRPSRDLNPAPSSGYDTVRQNPICVRS